MAKRRGSYDRAAIVKPFDDLTEAQKLRNIRKALRCGCPGCQAWLEWVPAELIRKVIERGQHRDNQ